MPTLLKFPKTNRWTEELLNSIWPHTTEQTADREILCIKKATEQRTLGTLAYNIK
jgi:hypothetical protein